MSERFCRFRQLKGPREQYSTREMPQTSIQVSPRSPKNHSSTIQKTLRVSLIRVSFCRIDNDKVETYSITQSFNKQENWTKALKYTLCNLKWALYWFVGNTNFQPLSATVSLPSDVSAAGSLYAKRGPDSNKPSGKNLRNS